MTTDHKPRNRTRIPSKREIAEILAEPRFRNARRRRLLDDLDAVLERDLAEAEAALGDLCAAPYADGTPCPYRIGAPDRVPANKRYCSGRCAQRAAAQRAALRIRNATTTNTEK